MRFELRKPHVKMERVECRYCHSVQKHRIRSLQYNTPDLGFVCATVRPPIERTSDRSCQVHCDTASNTTVSQRSRCAKIRPQQCCPLAAVIRTSNRTDHSRGRRAGVFNRSAGGPHSRTISELIAPLTGVFDGAGTASCSHPLTFDSFPRSRATVTSARHARRHM